MYFPSGSIVRLTDQIPSFGFIKYYNFEDAENCIRGFHHLGYEVSFARVRHPSYSATNGMANYEHRNLSMLSSRNFLMITTPTSTSRTFRRI